jgi:hypothetical protein
MTNLKRFLCLAALFTALLSADTVSTDIVTVTVSPTSFTLTDLYFLYSQGDVSFATPLNGDAPAGASTSFAVDVDIPRPIAGSPYYSVVGVYTPAAGPQGVFIAIDPVDSSIAAQPFTSVFTDYSWFFTEAELVEGMENFDSDTPDGIGFDLVNPLAGTPQAQDPPLFPLINLTGTTDATLFQYSDGVAAGSVELSLGSPTSATPEPSTAWMLGGLVLVVALARNLALRSSS